MNTIINRLTGSKIIYNKLIKNNVKDVFLYSGGAIMPVVDQFYNSEINYFINSHEQNAGHAATGYAKSTNRTGVCVVTSGPGLTNLITPMLDATNDSTPMVVISGQVTKSAMNTNAFQECAAVDISKSVTKLSYCVENVSELPYIIDTAFKVANDGKKGTVHVDIPKCVLSDNYVSSLDSKYKIKNLENSLLENKEQNKNDIVKIDSAMDIINNSLRPILIVGQGCNNSSELLRKFAINGNIPVTTTLHAVGCFDEEHYLSTEFLGMHGNVAANYAVQQSDCIIAIGSRFDDRTTGNIEKYAPEAINAGKEGRGGIIHINICDDEIDKIIKTDYSFRIDCGEFLKKALPKLKYNERKEWTDKIDKWKFNHPFEYNGLGNKLKTQDVISEINNKILLNSLSDRTIITTGVGNHQMMAAQFIKWKSPKKFVTSGSLGVMGAGLPYAIGCQIANPDKLVIDIDGDGSFNHTLSDLKTIVEYNLPVKIAIMNDGHMSMVRVWEELFFEKRYTATTINKNPNYKNLAKSFGIHAISCNSMIDLPNTVDYFLKYPGAILCDFRVNTDKCLPLVAPGKALDDLILHETVLNYVGYDVMPPN